MHYFCKRGSFEILKGISHGLIGMSNQRAGLLELVARGKKDAFFMNNPTSSFFHSVYMRAAPFAEEVYVIQPRNNGEWGGWVEFDYEHRGDLVRKTYIRLELPTWLPDSLASVNNSSIITDSAGVRYGYCNNIGFQMLEKIQVFQDQVLLQELYGEYLDWRLRQMNTLAATFVIAGSVGTRGETAQDIQHAATPGLLRVPIPFLGWEAIGDQGFPMVAMKQQRFRIRILLRKLKDVVVASDGRASPQPWGQPLRVQLASGGPILTEYSSLPLEQLSKRIHISLETTQVYVPRDIQEWFRIQKWIIPYRNAQQIEFAIDDNKWAAAALAVQNGTQFSLPFALDFIGPVSRLLVGFQSEGARRAGQRTELLSDAARSLRLNIANIDRIPVFDSRVFREVTAYWKNVRSAQNLGDPNIFQNVFTLTFGGRDSAQPGGTLNFTRATEPQLYAVLGSIPIDPRTLTRKSYLVAYAESWKIWVVQGGKGMVLIDE